MGAIGAGIKNCNTRAAKRCDCLGEKIILEWAKGYRGQYEICFYFGNFDGSG